MKPGSVIFDLAVAQGGNVEGSVADQVVERHGVKIIGFSNTPTHLAADASALFARNLYNFLSAFWDKEAGPPGARRGNRRCGAADAGRQGGASEAAGLGAPDTSRFPPAPAAYGARPMGDRAGPIRRVPRRYPDMKFIVPLMAATAMLSLSACKSEAPAPAAEETAAADAMAPEATATAAAGNSMVGGAEMFADKPIAENAVGRAEPDHAGHRGEGRRSGRDAVGPGPFTVFAPTNDAFAKVDKATLDGLMTPEGKASLTKVLTYHVVPGKMTAADLAAKIKEGNGTAKLKTVEGEELTLDHGWRQGQGCGHGRQLGLRQPG